MTITNKDLDDLEKWCEKLFYNSKEKKEMTFHFSNHFSDDRINDNRNNPLILLEELKTILTKFKNKHLQALYSLRHEQSFTLMCNTTEIAMVFAIEEERSKGFDYHRNIAVTIIRKKDFKPYVDDIIFTI